MASTTSTTSTAAAPSAPGRRRPPGRAAQILRLTRTEFTLVYRYRTALFFIAFPLLFTATGFAQQGRELTQGMDAGAYFICGAMVLAPLFIGLVHVSNVYTARRESLVLKRFRVSGVPPATLFGATLLSVLLLVLLLTAISAGALAFRFDLVPADPLLVVLPILLTTATMVFLGLALTAVTRSAEGAQMISMVPFFLLYASSGQMLPMDMLPDAVARVSTLLPAAPATAAVQSGYFGRDLFGGVDGPAASGLELWTAAAPSLGVMLVWLAVSVVLLRYFRWDPRQAK
ncbi:ABC-2 type transport system permease protein [Murinocardiopsis flavida]|uniref:ABC-2 type transport system permease protein n=1 Tax=Murinocardiopsis flavida TaxID=645275 RepID=A0A2P8DMZ5_9ACTN|nr:ABC transporter permease [Murinocardiopsis flavida]PSK98586.1 ABC-2 type transport system permease protein [Murinocardiopsis flavida]